MNLFRCLAESSEKNHTPPEGSVDVLKGVAVEATQT